MTNASDPSAGLQYQSRPTRALACVVVAFAILNSFVTWFARDGVRSNIVLALVYALFVSQPILFGIWTALGAGSILKRLPVTAVCLLLLFVGPGHVPKMYADIRANEFWAMVVMGFAVFTTTTALFLIVRWPTRSRIQPLNDESIARVTFSIKDLLLFITLCAVVLGMATQLNFKSNPPPSSLVFGFNFFLRLLVIGGSILAAAVLPVTFFPISILHGHPTRVAIYSSLAYWAVTTIAISVCFLDQNGTLAELVLPLLVLQLTAAAIGATTAIWLRYNGLRLVRAPRSEPVSSTIVLPSP